MLIDKTEGRLFDVLEWAREMDEKNGQEGETDSEILPGLAARLQYLNTYGIHVNPSPENHDATCEQRLAWDRINPTGVGDESKFFDLPEKDRRCTCGKERDDPRAMVVRLGDGKDRYFSVTWLRRKPLHQRDTTCVCRFGGEPCGRGCDCYVYSMNGAMVFHESDKTWGVHT